jgi:hypothetical protein
LTTNQISRQVRQAIVLILRPPIFDAYVMPFDITGFLQALMECDSKRIAITRAGIEVANHRHRRLLRPRRERPRGRAAEKRCELAPFHA